MLERFFSWPIVLLAWLVGMLVAYITIGLAGRIATLGTPKFRQSWLAGGAFSTGVGLWAMHFVGMLSFSLPIPIGYDLTITLATLGIAIAISYCSLWLVTGDTLSLRRLAIGGLVLGLGTAAMHYTGMAALEMSPGIRYAPGMVTISIAISIVGSVIALHLAFSMRKVYLKFWELRRAAGAVVMGTAVFGLHFTGMAAAHFPIGSICRAAGDLDAGWLAVTLAGGTTGVLAVTLVLTVLDARLENQTAGYASSLQRANEQLLHQATHDALTQLPNRIRLSERLQYAIDVAPRRGQHVAVFFLDLDGFKPVNDTLGHGAGDAVLKELAARLRLAIRAEDLVARFGGDEFVVVAEGLDGVSDASRIAERLFECFRRDFVALGTTLTLSPSMGISLFPQDGDTPELLIRHADAAMYQAKTTGRNRYRFFDTSMNEATHRTMAIQRALHLAIEHGQLFLEYQPKFACDGRTLAGAEALLRWHHPELGFVSPDEFIPVAEQSGQIVPIGRWVVTEVCAQLHRWRKEQAPAMTVAINLSPVQVRDANLVRDILAITMSFDVAPSSLMFEITESVAVRDSEATMYTLRQLRTAGFEMAIDDFGIGYSTLTYLRQYGVRQLKVDRLFVQALEHADDKARSIMSSIIGLAHSMGMEVVAEGVETPRQLSALRALNCDLVQGFYLSRPIRGSEFAASIADHLRSARVQASSA